MLFRPVVITGLVFSIFAIIISIVGAIVDGISAAVIGGENACYNTNTGKTYGSDSDVYELSGCTSFFYDHYDSQCICTDGSSCFAYDLTSGENCGSIYTTYYGLLSASTAFLVVLVILSFVYSIFTCIACNGSSDAAPPAAAPAPVVVQLAPNPAAPQQQQYAPVPVVGYVAAPAQQPVVYAAVEPAKEGI